MRPKLVIFDCDGVLIDSEAISALMLIETLRNHGVTVDLNYVSKHFLGRSYPTVLKQIRAEFNIVLSDEFEAEYRQRLLKSFATDLQIMPGVRAVITGLDVRYCLATSSSPERLKSSLKLVGLSDLFTDRMFTASEVANGKPAPDLFLHAAAKMNVAPADCLVIEDSLNGIRAGLAAGMKVWRFTGGSHISDTDRHGSASKEADFAFDKFDDFFTHAPALKVAGK